MKKIGRYFWNNENGYTAQNHAFLLFTTPYALAWIAAIIMTLIGIPVDPTFMSLLEIMQTPMLVVLGGIFSVNVATEIRKPNGDKNSINTSQANGNSQVSHNVNYENGQSEQNYNDFGNQQSNTYENGYRDDFK